MRPTTLLGAVVFFILAPGTVAGWIPYSLTGWRSEGPVPGAVIGTVVGAALIVGGAASLVESFTRFVRKGLGTPAPVAPPTELVVSGQYRYVRNPMYVAIVAILLGQCLLLGSGTLLAYAALVWLAFHLFVVAYEEPTLTATFGDSYREYRRRVGRWWPGVVVAFLLVAVAACGGAGSPDPPDAAPSAPGPPSSSPVLMGCPIFPADNPWNRDVSGDPVDPLSDTYIASIGATRFLHPDFGSNPEYGIPWTSVSGSQPRVPMTFEYSDESDAGPYPFPPDAPIEAGGDRHVLVLDRDACRLYETFDSRLVGAGWRCGSGAVFDLRSNALRPDGWTSADAAGLPILPGLVRRDEIVAGEIRHALRFTVRRTQRAFVHPATHYASSSTDTSLPPMGLRLRLKASYDLARFSGAARVILLALKRYGMFVADNGSDWFISGETNRAWNDEEIEPLKTVPGSAFEVVRTGEIHR